MEVLEICTFLAKGHEKQVVRSKDEDDTIKYRGESRRRGESERGGARATSKN